MKKPIFFILFSALILSAYSCKTTQGYHLNNQNEWAKSPDIDSLAFEALIDAENIWSQPELFEPIGFNKFSTAGGDFIINKTDKATVQVDLSFDGTMAEVTFLYSDWQGHWVYASDNEGGWILANKFYSSRFVPQIDEWINPMIQNLNSAALRADLAWLESFVGSLDYVTLDTTMTDKDSTEWHITYTTDPSQDWAWEYETAMDPTSSFVYYFDASGKCLRGTHFIYSMEFVEKKETTRFGERTEQIARFSGSFFELPCLSEPPIPTELTGLKP
ncbi:MAG TPA: hypothetical protein VJB09_01405 [Candidatus Paceibacterota bacterium]